MERFEITAVLTGRVKPLGARRASSAIDKSPVKGLLAFGKFGLNGDEQSDLRLHGGVEKAIHHYPFDHYKFWTDDLLKEGVDYCGPPLKKAGAFGENISTVGLTEKEVCLGDIFQLGTGVVQISQGRQPCWKLNERFGVSLMARQVQKTGRTGWYYRVLKEGVVGAGDCLCLKERLAPEWTLGRVTNLLYVDVKNFAALSELQDLPFLAPNWRRLAERRLTKGNVEDWAPRLDGPET
ncbi:MOSC domain-containing protein [Hyphomicrobiales bacterium 4NK60-0047b]